MVILEDGDVATITARRRGAVTTVDGEPVQREPVRVLWDPIMAEKGGYRHFMLKEIYEQPRAVTDTFRGRIAPETGSVVLPDVNLDPSTVRGSQRVVIVACGTSFHAAMLGRTMIEQLARMPVGDRPRRPSSGTATPWWAPRLSWWRSPSPERPPTPWAPSRPPS